MAFFWLSLWIFVTKNLAAVVQIVLRTFKTFKSIMKAYSSSILKGVWKEDISFDRLLRQRWQIIVTIAE